VLAFLAHQPLLLFFGVAALGIVLGRVRVMGFGLGVAAVLFVGLGVGALDPALSLPDFVYQFGLVLFVYTIGLTSGPGFFASLERRGLAATGLVLGVLGAAALVDLAWAAVFGWEAPLAAGVFAGALTNTPALAAVLERVHAAGGPAGLPVVGYSLAYPLGVLLALVVMSVGYRRLATPAELAAQRPREVEHVTVELGPDTPAVSLHARLEALGLARLVVSRLRRGAAVDVPRLDALVAPGDVLTLVGEAEDVARATALLGRRLTLELDRSVIDYRRIFVSNPELAARPLRDLQLTERYGAVITRLRRGDAELVPTGATTLELGDRVRVVAPRARIEALSRYFGDSYRALAEVDVATFGVGIALGLLVGLIPIPTPGGGHLELGLAGGPLLAGIVLGRLGRTGPLVWSLPYSANLTLRQAGLVLFLAGVGLRNGWTFAQGLASGGAAAIVLGGALLTALVTGATLLLARRVLGFTTAEALGAVAGLQTQPAALAFALERAEGEAPGVGYAAVFPIAMLGKIVLAQLLLAMG
jgi:putative transport protein